MKVIIAGSNTIKPHPSLISYAIYCSGFDITEVVCSDAGGIDAGGAAWAAMYNIPVAHFKPDWEQYGKRAGYLRNSAMAEHADAAIIIWDGQSKGSEHMINIARKRGMPLFILQLDHIRENYFIEVGLNGRKLSGITNTQRIQAENIRRL